jgi:hypothetical protein
VQGTLEVRGSNRRAALIRYARSLLRRSEHDAPTFEYVLVRPGGVGYLIPLGRAYRGQPVAIQRRARNGRWTRLATDDGVEGWVKSRALCG